MFIKYKRFTSHPVKNLKAFSDISGNNKFDNSLERYAENNISQLPNDWDKYINNTFGLTWTLHDFQISALKNALTVLHATYSNNNYIQQYFSKLDKNTSDEINKIFETINTAKTNNNDFL